MKIKMFGPRCLVEHYRPKSGKSAIIIPDATQQVDTHRFGKVVVVGDGRLKNQLVEKPLVSVGDVVMFQVNQVMLDTQKFVIENRNCMNLLQSEIIGRLRGDDITVDNLEMVGDYLLLKHFFRQPEGSKIVLPDGLMKQSAPDFIYFNVVLKGSTVDKPVNVGDEVIANLGRLTPLFFVKRNLDGTSENVEYCYLHKDWLDGVVEGEPKP